jgi:hypothetical protein
MGTHLSYYVLVFCLLVAMIEDLCNDCTPCCSTLCQQNTYTPHGDHCLEIAQPLPDWQHVGPLYWALQSIAEPLTELGQASNWRIRHHKRFLTAAECALT